MSESTEPKKEIDCSYTRQIVCPHCGYVDGDSWETSENMGDGDQSETFCGNCEEEFQFTICVDITYTSMKIPHKTEPNEPNN